MSRPRIVVLLTLSTITGCMGDDRPTLTEPDIVADVARVDSTLANDSTNAPTDPGLHVIQASASSSAGASDPRLDVSGSFRFRPPLGDDLDSDGEFDTSVFESLKVSICELTGSVCLQAPVATFLPGGENQDVRMRTKKNPHYLASWSPSETGAEVGERYRVHVTAAGLSVGSATVAVENGALSGDIVIKQKRTLPIKFQIDSNPTVRGWVLRAQGVAPRLVVQALVDEFGLSANEVVDVLSAVGFAASDVAGALRDEFGLDASEVAQILVHVTATTGPDETGGVLVDAGFGVAEIASALSSVFGMALEATALTLKELGFGPSDLAAAMSSAFGADATSVALVLRTLVFGAAEVAEALRSTFALGAVDVVPHLSSAGFDETEIGQGLAAAFSLDPDGVAAALTAAGWTSLQIAGLLRDGFALEPADVARVLAGSGFGLAEVAAALRTTFGSSDPELAAALLGGGFELPAVATWFQSADGKTEEETIVIFRTGSIPASDVGDWMVGPLGRSVDVASRALQVGGFDFDGVADWLMSGVGLTEDQVVETARSAGYGAGPAAEWVLGTLGKTREAAVGFLFRAGYEAEDAMQWLDDRFGDVTDRIGAGIAKGAGYGAKTITKALKKVYNLGAGPAAKVLGVVGFLSGEAADALEQGYGLGEEGVVAALDQGGYALSESVDWLESRGFDVEGAVGVLREGGIQGGRVVGLLADRFGDVVEDPAGFVFNVMAGAGYGFKQFASDMTDHFGSGIAEWMIGAAMEAGVGLPDTFALSDVLDWGLDVGALTLERLAQLAEQKGIPVTELVDWMTTKLPGQGAELAANVIAKLEGAGYAAEKIARGLVSFGLDTATEAMGLAEWTAAKTGQTLMAAYGLGEAAVVRAMDEGGFILAEIAEWLTAVEGKTLQQMADILSVGGVVADRIVDLLVDVYNRPADFVFNIMAGIGVGFQQFATRMVHHFGSGIRDWLIGAALDAGVGLPDSFSLSAIAEWSMSVGGMTTATFIAFLERKGVPAEDVIEWLTTTLPGGTQAALDEIASQLMAAGYAAEDVADWLAGAGDVAVARALKVAGFAADSVADAISAVYGLGVEATTRVMRVVGYSFENVLGWIETKLEETVPATIDRIVSVARFAGFDIHDVADTLKRIRGVPDRVMAVAMKAAGYAKSNVSAVLHGVYGLGAAAGAQIMDSAEYGYLEITEELFDEWSTEILAAGQILKDLGADYFDVLNTLSEVTKQGVDVIAAVIVNLF